MTKRRPPADDREPCPPVAVTHEAVVRAVEALVRTVREPDSYEAPTRRKRVAADGEIRTTVIDMKDKPPVTRPMPKCLYFPDDDSTIEREDA